MPRSSLNMIPPLEQLKRDLTGTAGMTVEEVHSSGIMEGKVRPLTECLTMVGWRRLESLHNLLEDVVREDIPGDIIECGVWRGGVLIWTQTILNLLKSDKRVFGADSFEGCPEPRLPEDYGDIHHKHDHLRVPITEVEANLMRYGHKNVTLLKGWFKDSLPLLPESQKFSIIRLDGDLYESTMDCLQSLYKRLSPGGYCIIDDWHLGPVRTAVARFLGHFKETPVFIHPDKPSICWKKS